MSILLSLIPLAIMFNGGGGGGGGGVKYSLEFVLFCNRFVWGCNWSKMH